MLNCRRPLSNTLHNCLSQLRHNGVLKVRESGNSVNRECASFLAELRSSLKAALICTGSVSYLRSLILNRTKGHWWKWPFGFLDRPCNKSCMFWVYILENFHGKLYVGRPRILLSDYEITTEQIALMATSGARTDHGNSFGGRPTVAAVTRCSGNDKLSG
jgi:hypothetical protein